MRRKRAFTMYELVAVILIVVVMAGVILPLFIRRTGPHPQMDNSRHLRGIHQAMVVFSSTNNTFFPGLDSDGNVIPNGPATGNSGAGDTGAARFWILLNAQFINGYILRNPQDSLTKYATTAAPLTTANFSYASLWIGGKDTSNGRCSEWRDNANSTAVLISDRNTGTSNADSGVSSLWTNKPGDWKGNLVWGDNHAEYVQSSRGFTTRYLKTTQTNDNLFATAASPGVTDNSTAPDSNAFMVWN